LGLADVAALMKKVDGVLWVVRRAHAKREAVEAAGQFLAGFSDLSTGLIVNQADDYASYGYYGYQKESAMSAEPSQNEIMTDRKITT
jgi:Mrp family chromosome partitioning ATPase